MRLSIIITVFLFFIFNNVRAQQDIFELARRGSVEDIKSMYAKDAESINSVNDEGYTPLILASYSDNVDVVRFLADKVGDIDANCKYGTALMAATYKGSTEIVKLLLSSGSDPNLQDERGTTAAHFAIMFKRYELIALLKEFKADFSLKNKQNQSPLDYAKTHNDKTINKLLNL